MGAPKGIASNQLKAFKVSIDGTDIILSQVQSFKLKWGISDIRVTGELVFHDTTSMVEEVPLRGGNTVTISITDFDDVIMTHTMAVVKVNYTRGQNSSYIVKLDLVDKVTLATLSKSPSKSWGSVKMGDVLNDSAVLKSEMSDKKTDFDSSDGESKNFIIPKDRSFYKVVTYLKENYGQLYFQTRDSYKVKSFNSLFSQAPKGDKFVYKPNNESYRRAIYEMNSDFGDVVKSLVFQPKKNTKSYDTNTKEETSETTDNKSTSDDIGSTGTVAPDYGDRDTREDSKTSNSKTRNDYQQQKNAYNEIKLEVLVPGKFDNNVGDIVDVDLINFFTKVEPEKNVSGSWLVDEIIDVIQPPDFLQRIVLVRGKFAQ